jgi:hypothetical protein
LLRLFRPIISVIIAAASSPSAQKVPFIIFHGQNIRLPNSTINYVSVQVLRHLSVRNTGHLMCTNNGKRTVIHRRSPHARWPWNIRLSTEQRSVANRPLRPKAASPNPAPVRPGLGNKRPPPTEGPRKKPGAAGFRDQRSARTRSAPTTEHISSGRVPTTCHKS